MPSMQCKYKLNGVWKFVFDKVFGEKASKNAILKMFLREWR